MAQRPFKGSSPTVCDTNGATHLYSSSQKDDSSLLRWRSVILRLTISLYMAFMAWRMWVTCIPRITYFKYLTNCGWTIQLTYFVVSLYHDIWLRRATGHSLPSPNQIKAMEGIESRLMEVSFALQVVTTVFFWLVVFPAPTDIPRDIMWDAQFHGVGLAIIITDYLCRYLRFSLSNHRWLLRFATAYSIGHVACVYSTGEAIYPGMYFREKMSFFYFFSGITTLVLFHKIFYVITHWKRIKAEVKTMYGIAHVVLVRQSSTSSLISVSGQPSLPTPEDCIDDDPVVDQLVGEMDRGDISPTASKG